jgi:MFS family permease
MEVIVIDELRRCSKCGYETMEVVSKCPQCGRKLLSAGQVRRLGWAQLILGLFLVGLMGTITFNLAPSMLRPGASQSGTRFTGTPEQAQLILGLFGLVIVFGLTGIVNGLWQIITGRRNKWILVIILVLAVLLIVGGRFVYKALGG